MKFLKWFRVAGLVLAGLVVVAMINSGDIAMGIVLLIVSAGIWWALGLPLRRARERGKEEERERKMEAHKTKVAAEKVEEEKELIETFGEDFASAIRSRSVAMAMPSALLFKLFGYPEDKKETVTKSGKKVKCYFKGEEGSRGGISYALEVTVEDGVVTGWKER